MSGKNPGVFAQIHRNAVALISLVVAVSSLSYNTWRNEVTEANRNQRVAAFELLSKLNDLQQVVFYHYYDQDVVNKGNPRTGWTYVLTIHDLSQVLDPPLPESADQLRVTWNEHWQALSKNQTSVDVVLSKIDEMRADTLQLLQSLE